MRSPLQAWQREACDQRDHDVAQLDYPLTEPPSTGQCAYDWPVGPWPGDRSKEIIALGHVPSVEDAPPQASPEPDMDSSRQRGHAVLPAPPRRAQAQRDGGRDDRVCRGRERVETTPLLVARLRRPRVGYGPTRRVAWRQR